MRREEMTDMRIIEVRRHTMRHKPGQHLSQAGVTLARRVGEGIGPFARVVTSTLPRAFETSIAMGFAVDEQLAALSEMGSEVDAGVSWASTFAQVAQAARLGGPVARFALDQANLLRQIVAHLHEGDAALVISHGGIVELGAIGCLPDTDFTGWGEPCDYCEGVRLAFAGERFIAGEVLRVSSS
jgi:broad specificity phosphatase PhoE